MLKKLIVLLLINAVSLWAIDYIFAGISIPLAALLVMTVIMTLINLIVKPILKLISAPINMVSFGLFSVLVDAVILYFVFQFVPGAYFNNIITLLLASIVLGVINSVLSFFLG